MRAPVHAGSRDGRVRVCKGGVPGCRAACAPQQRACRAACGAVRVLTCVCVRPVPAAEPEAAACGAAMAPRRPSLLLLLACALALPATRPGAAAPAQPTYPGDHAPVEDLLRFYRDLQQYLRVVTRPR